MTLNYQLHLRVLMDRMYKLDVVQETIERAVSHNDPETMAQVAKTIRQLGIPAYKELVKQYRWIHKHIDEFEKELIFANQIQAKEIKEIKESLNATHRKLQGGILHRGIPGHEISIQHLEHMAEALEAGSHKKFLRAKKQFDSTIDKAGKKAKTAYRDEIGFAETAEEAIGNRATQFARKAKRTFRGKLGYVAASIILALGIGKAAHDTAQMAPHYEVAGQALVQQGDRFAANVKSRAVFDFEEFVSQVAQDLFYMTDNLKKESIRVKKSYELAVNKGGERYAQRSIDVSNTKNANLKEARRLLKVTKELQKNADTLAKIKPNKKDKRQVNHILKDINKEVKFVSKMIKIHIDYAHGYSKSDHSYNIKCIKTIETQLSTLRSILLNQSVHAKVVRVSGETPANLRKPMQGFGTDLSNTIDGLCDQFNNQDKLKWQSEQGKRDTLREIAKSIVYYTNLVKDAKASATTKSMDRAEKLLKKLPQMEISVK